MLSIIPSNDSNSKKSYENCFLILKKHRFWNKKNSAITIFLKLAHFTHFKITGKCVKF